MIIRVLLTLAIIVAVVVGIKAVGGSISEHRGSEASDHFWRQFYIRGLGVEAYDSFPEMAKASDAIVLARIASIHAGRTFGNDASGYAHYVTLRLDVGRQFGGRVSIGSHIDLELMVPERFRLEHAARELPREPTLFFLRSKQLEAAALGWSAEEQAGERPYFRPVMSQAVFRNIGGSVRTALTAEDDYILQWNGRPFDELLREVEVVD